VLAVCPGAVNTGGLAEAARTSAIVPVLDPGQVVSFALKKLGKTGIAIPGLLNRIAYSAVTHILPRKAAAVVLGGFTSKIMSE
jgi:hypothetical protein